METTYYEFSFAGHVPMRRVSQTLMVAVHAIESIHGKPAMRMESGLKIDPETGACTMSADSYVGEDLARAFAGFLNVTIGETAYQVTRGSRAPKRRAGGILAFLQGII